MKIFSRIKLAVCIFLTSGCVHASSVMSADGFPDAWWAAVPQDQIKGWEIPPQSANRANKEVILSKRTELGQFSNLGAVSFEMDGVKYKSVEALWQGMKYPESANDDRLKDPTVVWPYTREQVYQMDGFQAKKAGDIANENMKKLGIKYITYLGQKIEYNGSGMNRHYEIIYQASKNKILQNPALKELLLSSKDLKFFPDHKQQANPNPAYLYHEIYMKIRLEIAE